MSDPLERLSRDDKWYLGGAPALLFAPPVPLWLDRPGFWDALHYLHFPIEPGFTLSLIDEAGTAIPLRFEGRRWRPDRLEGRYTAPDLGVIEYKTCGPEDAASAIIEIHNLADTRRNLQLLAWTAQPMDDATFHDAGYRDDHVFIRREIEGLRQTQRVLTLALGLEGARSGSVDLSEAAANQPHFFFTPYFETLTAEGLDNRVKLTGVNLNGLVYAALERPLELAPRERLTVKTALALASETDDALRLLNSALQGDPLQASEAAWRKYFGSVPEFSCSNPYLETYYPYSCTWYFCRFQCADLAIA